MDTRGHTLSIDGSSPLTRGKHHHGTCTMGRVRLIPAHAGKTVVCIPASSSVRAHPRSRGENKSTKEQP